MEQEEEETARAMANVLPGGYDHYMEDEDGCHFSLHPLPLEEFQGISPRPRLDSTGSTGTSPPNLPDSSTKYFSVVMGISQKRERRRSRINVCRRRWQQAILKARTMTDPWEKFHLDEYPTEKALRFRYNTFSKEWIVDHVMVKMEAQVRSSRVKPIMILWLSRTCQHEQGKKENQTRDHRFCLLIVFSPPPH